MRAHNLILTLAGGLAVLVRGCVTHRIGEMLDHLGGPPDHVARERARAHTELSAV